MSWTDHRPMFQEVARRADPAVLVTTKDHWLWSLLWVLLVVLTFGLITIKMGHHRFKHEYATTIGPFQGYPREWLTLDAGLIVHEADHTTVAAWLGWVVPIVGWFFGRRVRAVAGLIPMGLIYGLIVLPVGLAFGRLYLELRADRARWRWMKANGYTDAVILRRAEAFGKKVCGGEYLWAVFGGAGLFTRSARKVVRHAESP